MSVAEKVQSPLTQVAALPRLDVKRLTRELAAPATLFILAFVVFFQYDPLNRTVGKDPAIFVYISKLVAQGIAPHLGAFNEEASLAFILGGAAMVAGNLLHVPELVAMRLLSLGIAALVVVGAYLVAFTFSRLRVIAFTAGLIMLSFSGFGNRVASAIDPKATMLMFGLPAIYVMSQRRWFWAGFLGACAGLGWQIGWGYAMVALLLAFVQSGPGLREKFRAAGAVLFGFMIPLILYALYFYTHGALGDMLQQTLLYPFLVGRSKPVGDFAQRIPDMIDRFNAGYRDENAFGVLGFIGWIALLWRSLIPPRHILYYFFRNRRTSAALLSFHGFLFYSFLDFQNYPDWIPLLPFVAIFGAWFFWKAFAWLGHAARLRNKAPCLNRNVRGVALALILALIFSAGSYDAFELGLTRSNRGGVTWRTQSAIGYELNRQLGSAPVVAFGKPELLYFMGRRNPTNIIYLLARTDLAVDTFEPGGFMGLVATLKNEHPSLVVMARVRTRRFANHQNYVALNDWIETNYVLLSSCRAAGGGKFYLRGDLADTLFPKNASGNSCFKRIE